MKNLKLCPCHSASVYSACCKPFHNGTRSPACPEQLMRSRYSAYALGLSDYLWQTLAQSHLDRQSTREAFAHSLKEACREQRFLGLWIIDAEPVANTSAAFMTVSDTGTVLFFARVFAGGRDHSFAERSRFIREGDAWRYATGQLLLREQLPKDPLALPIEEWRALFSRCD